MGRNRHRGGCQASGEARRATSRWRWGEAGLLEGWGEPGALPTEGVC